jgi:hypothetical protein
VTGRRAFLLAVALAAAVPTAAQAQTPPETVGIRIVDAPVNRANDPRALQYIVDHVAPGTTISRRVEVANNTRSTQAVQVYAASASVKDGNFLFGDGRSANDLTTWTTVGPSVVSPAAGAKTQATVTIAVPANASPGERYGVVWAELPPATAASGGISAVNRVGVRIYLSVGPGGEPASDFGITTFEAQRDSAGNPVVAAVVNNSGGRALDLSGELRLSNGPGGLATGPFDAKLGTTLGVGQTQPVLVVLDPALPAGPWTARLTLRSGTTERDATAIITFPAASATSGAPVVSDAEDDGRSPMVLILACAVVASAGGMALLVRRRTRRRGDAELPA